MPYTIKDKTGRALYVSRANDLADAVMEVVRAGRSLANADLRGLYLAGFSLAGARMAGADLRGAQFPGCQMAGADLTDVLLDGTNFAGSQMDGVLLGNAQQWKGYFGGTKVDAPKNAPPIVTP